MSESTQSVPPMRERIKYLVYATLIVAAMFALFWVLVKVGG